MPRVEGWLAWAADEDGLYVWTGAAWTAFAGGGGTLDNVVEDSTPQLGGDLDANGHNIGFDNGTGLTDDAGNEQVTFHKTASAVNQIGVTNAATGNAPQIAAEGGDTNIDLTLAGKGSGHPKAALFGVNATADATTKFAVAAAASLFNHAGAGHQAKINKNAAGDTASLLFQTGASGRAGCRDPGDDNFHFKVSPDGSTWKEAIVIDRSTGVTSFPLTPKREMLTANRTYYVRTDGSDSNDGLANTSGGAFLTIAEGYRHRRWPGRVDLQRDDCAGPIRYERDQEFCRRRPLHDRGRRQHHDRQSDGGFLFLAGWHQEPVDSQEPEGADHDLRQRLFSYSGIEPDDQRRGVRCLPEQHSYLCRPAVHRLHDRQLHDQRRRRLSLLRGSRRGHLCSGRHHHDGLRHACLHDVCQRGQSRHHPLCVADVQRIGHGHTLLGQRQRDYHRYGHGGEWHLLPRQRSRQHSNRRPVHLMPGRREIGGAHDGRSWVKQDTSPARSSIVTRSRKTGEFSGNTQVKAHQRKQA